MWMLVEGIHLLSKVKTVFKPINKLRVAYALAYGKKLTLTDIKLVIVITKAAPALIENCITHTVQVT